VDVQFELSLVLDREPLRVCIVDIGPQVTIETHFGQTELDVEKMVDAAAELDDDEWSTTSSLSEVDDDNLKITSRPYTLSKPVSLGRSPKKNIVQKNSDSPSLKHVQSRAYISSTAFTAPGRVQKKLELDHQRTHHREILCRAARFMGVPLYSNPITCIVYCDPDTFLETDTYTAAKEMSFFNAFLHITGTIDSNGSRKDLESVPNKDVMSQGGTPYIVVGLGRWGTSTASLGIPVNWADIKYAFAIIETGIRGRFCPEPSFASHFADNLRESGISFLYVDPMDQDNPPETVLFPRLNDWKQR
jgi:hypothetical protein